MNRAWIDLDPADVRNMLVSLIGYRFGEQPETRVDEIRTERRAYAQKFLRLADVRKHQSVIDLGSGCGFGTGAIAEQAGSVQACDISPAFLDFARRECADKNNIQFRAMQPRDLSPIADQSIDTVISMSVFIHLNLYDIACYFAEFSRVLKPGGKVVFDFADSNRLFRRFRTHGNDDLFREHTGYYRENPASLAGLVQFNSARGITQVAKDAGFKRIKRRGHVLLFAAR
ncbi:MAG: class I SAM-dependent methyltransferase [Xanthomonadales bacterium]|nr:class I SAM-dependent methyltransferase [Xanthomonadales bacterium]